MASARAGMSSSWSRACAALGCLALATVTVLTSTVAPAMAQTAQTAQTANANDSVRAAPRNSGNNGAPSRASSQAAPTPTSLRGKVWRRTVLFGGEVTVSGRLTRAGDTPMRARRIELLAKKAGNDGFSIVSRQRTARDGTVQWRVAPRRHTAYRLRYRGSPTTTGSRTAIHAVSVRPHLHARLGRGSMPVGQATRVRGRLRPGRSGALVLLQRRLDGSWQTTARQRLSPRSRFAFRVQPSKSVRGHYRVVRPADRGHLRAMQRAGRLHVYRVKITRIRFNPPRADDRHLNRERVTVVNTGRVGVRLRGWRLHATRSGRTRPLPSYRLQPGGRVRLHSGRGATERGSVHLRSARPLWANHYGSRARLIDRNDAAADRFSYDAPPPLRGLASWYGPGFEGNFTACGNRFDPSDFSLASRELPCGTPVRVVGPRGGVNAVVDDYGPASWTGRRFDLSRATFAAVQHITAGTTRVRVHRR